MLFMLTVEYREAKLLIKNNQFLMQDTLVKTLTTNISERVSKYPSSNMDINKNWHNLPLDIIVNYQGEWVFPFRFSGTNSNDLSELWLHYDLEKNDKRTGLSDESELRVKALSQIKKALSKGDQVIIKQQLENYFSIVENYQLSALEEIIAGLTFLQLEKDFRWNSQLIQLIVFQGSHQIIPLVDYIFKNNDKLSRADIKLSISKIQQILESANLDVSWFNQTVDKFWLDGFNLDVNLLNDYSVIDGQWISIRISSEIVLILPFSIEEEVEKVELILKSQGVLDKSDQLTVVSDNSMKIKNLVDFSIDIKRKKWEDQANKQNRFFWIKIILTLIFIVSIFVVLIFVSYRNKKKEEFIDMRENFINLVSHELKTPLASIRLMIETLQKRHDRELSISDYPTKIINEVDRLWLMVDNLLSLNQIKSGELKLAIDRINLNRLLDRIKEKFNEHLSKKLIFSNHIPDDFFCRVDPLLFELVIINLFSNAMKYCDKPFVQIDVRLNLEQNKLLFTDNACGIDQSNWERVFDNFYRDTRARSKQGSGVGLSLCRQIMKVHQSTITIIESDERGTIWGIGLPDVTETIRGKSRDC